MKFFLPNTTFDLSMLMKQLHGAELKDESFPDNYITGLEDPRAEIELLGNEMTDRNFTI